jgi:peroxiredoxin
MRAPRGAYWGAPDGEAFREGEAEVPDDRTLSRRALLSLPLAAIGATLPVAACGARARTPSPVPASGPRPRDDGAARHLFGMVLPSIALSSTSDRAVNLSSVPAPRLVVYAYPMTARPGTPIPPGYGEIPGARGCTAETCAFRDHKAELSTLGVEVFGVSTQSTGYQKEMVARLRVPFEILSDEDLRWTRALDLPTFEVEGRTLLKRLTLIVRQHRIEQVFYPVFPPETHADEVLAWLGEHPL